MSTDLTLVPFDQVIEGEEWAIPCECKWHRDKSGDAEWIVVTKPWCCRPGGPKTWCDDCLQEVMHYDGRLVRCVHCHAPFPERGSEVIISVEPLYRNAA